MRGRGALSGGSTPGARGLESFRELPNRLRVKQINSIALSTNTKTIEKEKHEDLIKGIHCHDAPHWIAPQLRAQGHVEARRQKISPPHGHAAINRLAVRRDAAARRQRRRQRLAAVGAGPAKVLDLELLELDSGQRRCGTRDALELRLRSPRRGSAAAHGGKARFLRLVRGRLAATSADSMADTCMDFPCSATSSRRHTSIPSNRH